MRGFVDASKLTVGHRVQTRSGALLTVMGVVSRAGSETAYNLEVAQLHTYYAGSTPVLVHNDAATPFDKCPHTFDFDNPEVSPGPDWKWHGEQPVGGGKGGWTHKETGESLHPDLGHELPKGPHWDWNVKNGGKKEKYQVDRDGNARLNQSGKKRKR